MRTAGKRAYSDDIHDHALTRNDLLFNVLVIVRTFEGLLKSRLTL